ncbi:MAG: MarR family transcriptional regulator [Planctomycetaceae bacterium]|nr:MarR family transcriptional regulator [Planctomycetaceae bacterium]
MLSPRNEHTAPPNSADRLLIEQIRQGAETVRELCAAGGVTATAIRQRLSRLEAAGLVEKQSISGGRGRPRNAYRVTELGCRQLGSKVDDLAVVLWSAITGTEEPELRERLFSRLRESMRERYGRGVTATSVSDRMQQLCTTLHDQGFPVQFVSGDSGTSPVLRETHCPYHEISSHDAGICELERAVYSDVLGAPVELKSCCREGEGCCQFEVALSGGS